MTQGLPGAGGGTTQKRVVPAYLTYVDEAGIAQQMAFSLVSGEDYDFDADITEHPVEVGSDITDNVRDVPDVATLEVFLTNEPIESTGTALMVQGIQVLSPPQPPPAPPGSPIIQYDKWDNMLTERALLTGAGGPAGGAVGGVTGSLVGAAAGGVLGALLLQPHATPVVQPVDMGLGPAAPSPPITAQTFAFLDTADFVADQIALLRQLKSKAQLFDIVAPRLTIDEVVIKNIKVHRGPDTGTGAKVTLSMKQIRFVSTVQVPAPKIVTAKPVVNRGEQNPTVATPQQAASAAVGLAAMLTGTETTGNFSLAGGP